MGTVFTLPNGIRCIHEGRPGSGHVIVRLAIHAGPAHDSIADNGLAFLTQEATNGGTKNWTREHLTHLSETRAANLISVAEGDMTMFGVNCFSSDIKEIFPLMADMVLNPVYDPAEVNRTKTQIKQWIVKNSQTPEEKVGALYGATVFAGQAMGLQDAGRKDTIDAFTIDQIKARHAELISRPEDIVISFGGDLDMQTAQDLAMQYFGSLQPAGAPRVQPEIRFTPGDVRVPTDNEHLHLRFGFKAPGLYDPERVRFMLLNGLLSGAMSSPLFTEIREKRSLVYHVGSDYMPERGDGVYTFTAGMDEKNARELIAESLNLLGRFARDGFTEEQIAQARERLVRSLNAGEEDIEGLVKKNFRYLLQRGRINSPREVEAKLLDITNDDLRHACADLLKSGDYALAAVGPQGGMPAPAEIKSMIAAQLEGLSLPPKRPATEVLGSAFAGAVNAPEEEFSDEPQYSVLPNGLQIITIEKAGTLSSGMWVGVGSAHETEALSGATHMNEHMMFRGTESFADGEVAEIVSDEMGGGMNAYTSQLMTAYFVYNLLPSHLRRSLSILNEMVFKATISDAVYAGGDVENTKGEMVKIAGERSVVYEEIKMRNDQIARRVYNTSNELCYPGQPHGRPTLGTAESLAAISAADLRAHRDDYYAPNNVTVVVTGPVKHADVVEEVKAMLGNMPPAKTPELTTPVYHGGVRHIEMKDARMATAQLAMGAVGSAHPDANAYSLLGGILSAGHSSRLFAKLGLQKEILTSIGVGINALPNAGLFTAAASFKPDHLREVMATVYKEIAGVIRNLESAELDKAKAMEKAQLIAALGSNSEICNWYGRNALHAGGLYTPAEEIVKIEAVTVSDIKRVAADLLRSLPSLAVVVPPGTDPALVPGRAELISMRDAARLTLMGSPSPTVPEPSV
jgi:predicted Zn-dependent peptidase